MIHSKISMSKIQQDQVCLAPRKPGRPLTHRPTVRLHAHVRLPTRRALIERAGGPCKLGVLLDNWADAAAKAKIVTPFNAQ